MTNSQFLKLLATNRELIQRNNAHAIEHLQMLKNDYGHLTDPEVVLNIELNNSLLEIHFHSNHEAAVNNSLQAIEKYKDCEFKNLLARHYWLAGQSFTNQSQYKKGKEYLLLGLNILVPGADYVPIKTDILIGLAMNEEFANRGAGTAIRYLEEAMPLLEHEDYAIRRASCLMGMGNVSINAGNVQQALNHYHAAAEIYERFFDLANMAGAYSNLGTCYITLKDYAKAEKFLQRSLELRTKFGSPDHIAISYYNLAMVYNSTGRPQLALEVLDKSKELIERSGNLHYMDGYQEMRDEILAQMPQLAIS